MSRNRFTVHGVEPDPEEVPEGESSKSPSQEIPEENLGGLFEDNVQELIDAVKSGELGINDARDAIGLPPISEDLKDTLAYLQGNAGLTTTEQHLERLRDPSRWERG